MKLFFGIGFSIIAGIAVLAYIDTARQPAGVILATTAETEVSAGEIKRISLTSHGYEPSELVLTKGDSVVWTNETKDFHWPASDPHPSHKDYPEFDPKRPLAPDEEWKFTFDKVGEWKFHDHIKANIKGTILVEEEFVEPFSGVEGFVE